MGAPRASVGMENGNTTTLAVPGPRGCSKCGWMPAAGARFCSRCGASLVGDGDDEARLREPQTTYVAERRLFGVPPPELLCALGTIGFVVGIVLLASGRWAIAAAVIAPALLFGGMFVSTAERFPESRTARAAVAGRGWASRRLTVICVSLEAWSTAAAEILRLARRQRKLRAEMDGQIGRLGEAVYADDPALADYLKAEAHTIGDELGELEHRRASVLDDVHQRVDQAKV